MEAGLRAITGGVLLLRGTQFACPDACAVFVKGLPVLLAIQEVCRCFVLQSLYMIVSCSNLTCAVFASAL
jgi:hypothetical protein